jgi:type II secretion system protein N
MSPRVRTILIWTLYPAFYFFCFALFAYLTFPFERLRDRIEVAFAEDQRKSGGDMRLQIDHISSYWFSGIEARGVRVISPPSVKPDGTKKPPSAIELEEVTARVAMLPLLIGRVTINFSAKLLGGTIDGSTRKKGEERSLELDVEQLAIGRFDPLVQLVGLPMDGTASGNIDLTLAEGKVSKSAGSVKLVVADFAVGDGKAKIRDTIALPKVVVGELEIDFEIEAGKLKINKLGAAGKDLDFSADGKVTLRDVLAESQADVYLKFRFSDKYKAKDDKTQALFGAPGSSAPALFEIADPRIRQSKRPDGFYSWRAFGSVRTLRFDPAPAGGAKAPGAGGKPGSVRGFMD